MKKILVVLIAACAFSATTAAFAETQNNMGKNECILASKSCKDQVDSIQQKIHKIDAEIKKGKKVYSADDLKKLHAKLLEAKQIIIDLEKPGR